MKQVRTNVLVFADHAETIRTLNTEKALEQRAKELRFKQAATGKKIKEADLSEAELIGIAHDTMKSADVFYKCLKFWERLAEKKSRQLERAEKKIARLEKKLAAKPWNVKGRRLSR